MNASSGVVRDDKQKLDHDGGLEASVGGLFHLKTPSAASGSSVYASGPFPSFPKVNGPF